MNVGSNDHINFDSSSSSQDRELPISSKKTLSNLGQIDKKISLETQNLLTNQTEQPPAQVNWILTKPSQPQNTKEMDFKERKKEKSPASDNNFIDLNLPKSKEEHGHGSPEKAGDFSTSPLVEVKPIVADSEDINVNNLDTEEEDLDYDAEFDEDLGDFIIESDVAEEEELNSAQEYHSAENESELEKHKANKSKHLGQESGENVTIGLKVESESTQYKKQIEEKIIKEEKSIDKNVQELNRINSEKRISDDLVAKKIEDTLKTSFGNICFADKTLLCEDKKAKQEFTEEVERRRQIYPDKQFTEIIGEVFRDWTKSKKLFILHDDGTIEELTPEMKEALVESFVRIFSEILHNQVLINNNSIKIEKTHELETKKIDVRVYPLELYEYKPVFFTTFFKAITCFFVFTGEICEIAAKKIEDQEKHIRELSDRIHDIAILKQILKYEIEKYEIEKAENKHEITIIDGLKLDSLTKVYQVNHPNPRNIYQKYLNMFQK